MRSRSLFFCVSSPLRSSLRSSLRSRSATLYFVALILFGIIILMNLFLAILLNNFSDVTSGKAAEAQAKLVRI